MSRRDGGPAFPELGDIDWNESGTRRILRMVGGMSLRDYFAAVEQSTYRPAAAGLLGRIWEWLWWGPTSDDATMARECYEAADAMLEERAEGGAS